MGIRRAIARAKEEMMEVDEGEITRREDKRREKQRLHRLALKIQTIALTRVAERARADTETERAFDMAEKIRDRHEGRPTERHEIAGVKNAPPVRIEGVIIGSSDESKPFKSHP